MNNFREFKDVKGVLLDVDGTLYHQTPVRLILVFLLVTYNLYNPNELIRKIKVISQYRKSLEALRNSEERPGSNDDRQLKHTAGITGESTSYIAKVIDEWFRQRPLPVIRLCRRKGLKRAFDFWFRNEVKLGVFSDYPTEEKVNALGISKFLCTIVSSADPEVSGYKPETNGFEIAARRMGLDPADILYVGDRPEVDGEGASRAGMQVAIISSSFKNRNGRCAYPVFGSFGELLKKVK